MSKELLTDGMDNASAFDPHEVVISYEDAKRAIAAALAEKDAVIDKARQALVTIFETSDDDNSSRIARQALVDLDGAK